MSGNLETEMTRCETTTTCKTAEKTFYETLRFAVESDGVSVSGTKAERTLKADVSYLMHKKG